MGLGNDRLQVHHGQVKRKWVWESDIKSNLIFATSFIHSFGLLF